MIFRFLGIIRESTKSEKVKQAERIEEELSKRCVAYTNGDFLSELNGSSCGIAERVESDNGDSIG